MKTLCDFCFKPLSIYIYSIDDEMPHDKYVCSYCPGIPMYTFKDDIFISIEFWFALEATRSRIIRQRYCSEIHSNYWDTPSHGPRYPQTWALEIWEQYHHQSNYIDPKNLYHGNELAHLTPFNAKQKMDTILTFM